MYVALIATITVLNSAIKVVYSSDPNYKKCSRLGTQYGRRCYEVRVFSVNLLYFLLSVD